MTMPVQATKTEFSPLGAHRVRTTVHVPLPAGALERSLENADRERKAMSPCKTLSLISFSVASFGMAMVTAYLISPDIAGSEVEDWGIALSAVGGVGTIISCFYCCNEKQA